MLPKIQNVKVLSDKRLEIEFDDGAVVIKDLNPLIIRGNLFLAFKDDDFLRQVQITERRRSLLWPNGLEFCADALKMGDTVNQPKRKNRQVPAVTHTN